MITKFQTNELIHSARKLVATYEFNIESDIETPTIQVSVWELYGENVSEDYKYEAELSHTIQNANQGTPYNSMQFGRTPEEAADSTVSSFMNMFDGKTAKIEPIKRA
ncbi:hypothetical protein JO972_16685 [Verrucomicrobiaceae bacterium 5K15]|uniref:Uncharacterized protein n=1 Tax=Oceaniferula flava TaxID=2800421 RepID=A0AAE2VAD3_9BACT|nr:hypothetical protein [Oceaniferula flavus]MBK1856603.1 hypothetical protein [Oceaniferula flavus]MBM1137911.1 hypothetical protein [Oceaniferula flavus]